MTANREQYKLNLDVLSLINEKDGKLTYDNEFITGGGGNAQDALATNLIAFTGSCVSLEGSSQGDFMSFKINGDGINTLEDVTVNFNNGLYMDTADCFNAIKSNPVVGTAFSLVSNADKTFTVTNLDNAFETIDILIPIAYIGYKIYVKAVLKSFSAAYTTTIGFALPTSTTGASGAEGSITMTPDILTYEASSPKMVGPLAMSIYGLANAGESMIFESLILSSEPITDVKHTADKKITVSLANHDKFHMNGSYACRDTIDLIEKKYTSKTCTYDPSMQKGIISKKVDNSNIATFVTLKDNTLKSFLSGPKTIKARIEGNMLTIIYNPSELKGYAPGTYTLDTVGDFMLNSDEMKKVLFELSTYTTSDINSVIQQAPKGYKQISVSNGIIKLIAPSKFDFKSTKQLELDHLALKQLVENTIIPQTVNNAMDLALSKYSMKATEIKNKGM